MTAYKVSFAIMGVCLLLATMTWADLDTQSAMLNVACRADSQMNQSIEARAAAKLGHQIVVNREAVKALEPGDIVKFKGLHYSFQGYVVPLLVGGVELQLSRCGVKSFVGFDDDDNMSPVNFHGVYKCGTPKWAEVCKMLVLESVPKLPTTTKARGDFPEVIDTRPRF